MNFHEISGRGIQSVIGIGIEKWNNRLLLGKDLSPFLDS